MAPHQLTQLQAVIGGGSASQIAWFSGYLAHAAGAGGDMPVNDPGPLPSILYASQTGNARALARGLDTPDCSSARAARTWRWRVFWGDGVGCRLNKLYRENIAEPQLLSELDSLFGRYSQERQIGERFGDFVVRVGIVARVVNAARELHD